MNAPKRTRHEIVLEILAALEIEPHRKTEIVYGHNLGFQPAGKILADLQERGMVAWDAKSRLFSLEPAGQKALTHLRKGMELIEEAIPA